MWKRCALLPVGLWTTFVVRRNLGVGCVETCWTSGLLYFVWLCIGESQGLIQVSGQGRLSRAVQFSS
jgi:hypothetical protein